MADSLHACSISGEDADMADGTRIYFFFKSGKIRNLSHSGFGSLWLPTERRGLKQMATDPSANVVNRNQSHIEAT